jgi:hypothetical protein
MPHGIDATLPGSEAERWLHGSSKSFHRTSRQNSKSGNDTPRRGSLPAAVCCGPDFGRGPTAKPRFGIASRVESFSLPSLNGFRGCRCHFLVPAIFPGPGLDPVRATISLSLASAFHPTWHRQHYILLKPSPPNHSRKLPRTHSGARPRSHFPTLGLSVSLGLHMRYLSFTQPKVFFIFFLISLFFNHQRHGYHHHHRRKYGGTLFFHMDHSEAPFFFFFFGLNYGVITHVICGRGKIRIFFPPGIF